MTTTLPRPFFIATDPKVIETTLESLWEQITGKPLLPGQPEKLFINVLAYVLTLHKVEVQSVGEQNLVNYSTDTRLDHLGIRLGVSRLPAAFARTTLRFNLINVLGFDLLIPSGTRAGVEGSPIEFATIADMVIPAGLLFGTAIAESKVAGLAGNNFAINQINKIPATIAFVQSVTNLSISSGGADIENDDRLRTRIKLAPNSFSVAGPIGAYRFHAMTADPSIIDVSVTSPAFNGKVFVYVLTATGIPSNETLQKVFEALNNKLIRPLTDDVSVLAPTPANFIINAEITFLAGADAASLEPLINLAAQKYVQVLRSNLGQDIVPSQIVAVLSLPGVYSVTLNNPGYQLLDNSQWANCTAITINLIGVQNG